MKKMAKKPRWIFKAPRFRLAPFIAIPAVCLLSACATRPVTLSSQAENTGKNLPLPPPAPRFLATGTTMTGTASWYGAGAGLRRTCSGQWFNGSSMTAASHSIPLGTQVRVALMGDQSRAVIVRVNDCMGRDGRILDLSRAAAQRLGIIAAGVARVNVTPVTLLADSR